MPHLGGDFAQRALLGVHHHVGLLVVRLALGEQITVSNSSPKLSIVSRQPMLKQSPIEKV